LVQEAADEQSDLETDNTTGSILRYCQVLCDLLQDGAPAAFSSSHFCCVIGPQAEGICPCMSAGDGGEIVTARTKDVIYLIVG